MPSLLPAEIDAYIEAHSQGEDDLLQQLRQETQATLRSPQMLVGAVEGAFLRLMVQLCGATRILEIGTFSGYSALCMASAMPPDGKLVTCDIDPVTTNVARTYWQRSPHGGKIELRLAPALETLAALAAEAASFDLAFIDADKANYVAYWDRIVPMMRTGGLILADNTLWSGRVLAPADDDDHGIVRFNRHVHADPRVEHVLVSIRDGVMLARKR